MVSFRPIMFFLTIFTSFTGTTFCACDATLIAFAILFKTSRLFAMTSFWVLLGVFMNFGFECMRIPFHYWFHNLLPFLVAILIAAILAIAFGATALTKSKAVTIEFQAFWFLAVARGPCAICTFFISLQKYNTLLIWSKGWDRGKKFLTFLLAAWINNCMAISWVKLIGGRKMSSCWGSWVPKRSAMMEETWALWSLELVIMTIYLVALTLAWVLLPLIMLFMMKPLCIRLLIALRSWILNTALSARSLIYPVLIQLRLMKKSFFDLALALLSTTLPTKLPPKSILFPSSLRDLHDVRSWVCNQRVQYSVWLSLREGRRHLGRVMPMNLDVLRFRMRW